MGIIPWRFFVYAEKDGERVVKRVMLLESPLGAAENGRHKQASGLDGVRITFSGEDLGVLGMEAGGVSSCSFSYRWRYRGREAWHCMQNGAGLSEKSRPA